MGECRNTIDRRQTRNVHDQSSIAAAEAGRAPQPGCGSIEVGLDCIEQAKPYKLIDAAEIAPARAAELAAQFIARQGVSVLNVAGPRASHAPAAHRYTAEAIARLLRS